MFVDGAVITMYVSGPDDAVKCFWCGGSLKAWKPTDRPLSEHIRWMPHCLFAQKHSKPSSAPLNVAGNVSGLLLVRLILFLTLTLLCEQIMLVICLFTRVMRAQLYRLPRVDAYVVAASKRREY